MARKKRQLLRDVIVTNENGGNSCLSADHWIYIDSTNVLKMDDETDHAVSNRPVSEQYLESFLDLITPTIRILQVRFL